MKKLFLLCLLASTALAVSYIDQNTKVKTENTFTNSVTITANKNILVDAGPSAGIDLERGGGVSSVVGAQTNATITSGSMRAYVWLPTSESGTSGAATNVTYSWIPYPTLDYAPSTGAQYAASGDKQSFSGTGRITWLPDSIVTTLSDAGTGTTLVETLTVRKGLPMGRSQ